jgi:hypothetical protein
LVKIQHYENNIRGGYTIFTYGTNTITEFECDKDGNFTDTSFFFLDQDGKVIKEEYIEKGLNTADTYDTNFYAYENGYLKYIIFKSHFRNISNTDTTFFEYAGGNLIRITQNEGGKTVYTTDFTYSTKPNKLGHLRLSDNYLTGHGIKPNTNLVQTETLTAYDYPVQSYVVSYKYTLDENNLPVQEVVQTVSGNGVPSNTIITTLCK